MVAISCASLWISCSKTSRCTFIETYSPAAIENAPARSPANPAMTTMLAIDAGPRHAEDQ